MIILAGLALAVGAVAAMGGDLRRLGSLRFRQSWLVFLSVMVQTVLVGTFGDLLPKGASGWIHVATYAVAGAFLWANRDVAGVGLVAIGGAMNGVAVALNGGIMPASEWAVRTAGLQTDGGFENSGVVRDARVPWLGDVLAVPDGWPLANVFSVGDVVLVIAAFVVLRGVCGGRSPKMSARVPTVGPCADEFAQDDGARVRATVPSRPIPPTSNAVPR